MTHTHTEKIALPEFFTPDTSELDEDHVRAALDFLIAVEPEPPPESREEYEELIEPYREQIAAAMATLRGFAEQTRSMTLEQLQADYYGFTNGPRYLVSANVAAVVQGALNEAWSGAGPWRR
jgi:hypothetical protein